MDNRQIPVDQMLRVDIGEENRPFSNDALMVGSYGEQSKNQDDPSRPRRDTLTQSNVTNDVGGNSDTITPNGNSEDERQDEINQNEAHLDSGLDMDNGNTNQSGTSSSSDYNSEIRQQLPYELDKDGKMKAYIDFSPIHRIMSERGIDDSEFVIE